MAEKFGNFRWVKEGYLDDNGSGIVVGRIVFAGIGPVELCLKGSFSGEIAGKSIEFLNRRFVDAEQAAEALSDMDNPHIGTVSLISFDPHPLLTAHPYFEWFSIQGRHYRFELTPDEAWIVSEEKRKAREEDLQRLRETLVPLFPATNASTVESHPSH